MSLTAANSYSGGTTVNNGTLVVGHVGQARGVAMLTLIIRIEDRPGEDGTFPIRGLSVSPGEQAEAEHVADEIPWPLPELDKEQPGRDAFALDAGAVRRLVAQALEVDHSPSSRISARIVVIHRSASR